MKTKSKKSYIVCSMPRSGSSLLCSWLSNSNVAGYPGEHINPNKEYKHFLHLSDSKKIPTCEEYIRLVVSNRTENGVFGTKLHWFQFNHILNLLKKKSPQSWSNDIDLINHYFDNPQFIYISRQDKIRQAISYYKAFETREWAIVQDRPKTKSDLKYNGEKIDQLLFLLLEHEKAWESFFESTKIVPYRISYEEFVPKQVENIKEVLSFLDIDYANIDFAEPIMKKQADKISDQWYERYLQDHLQILPSRQKNGKLNAKKIVRSGKYLTLVDPHIAIRYFETLSQNGKTPPYVKYQKALVHKLLGNLEESLVITNHLLKKHPNNKAYLTLRAELLIESNKADDALKDIELLESVAHDHDELAYLRAKALSDLGKIKEATEIFDVILKGNPKRRKYLLAASETHQKAGDSAGSLDLIKASINSKSNISPFQAYLRGVSKSQAGDLDGARKDFTTYMGRLGITRLTDEQLAMINSTF